VLSVGEIVGRIRGLIKQAFPESVWVEGQVSNCTYHSSGHIYFSLVDEQATDRFPGPTPARAGAGSQRIVLPCAFFRNANLKMKFRIEDGMKMLCFGQVSIYETKAQYQLIVTEAHQKGKGDLQVAFEQLKKRLGAEGLFDAARKRPIPRLPERVGIVTSPTGSAVHDMVARLRGLVHVVVVPAKVQGEGAALEIAEAIRLANAQRLADVLIVGRGGGSLEDLWAFNEEVVARAIFNSHIPVISAVGHEDHWTIADYVADLRASTPTHAAQLLAQEQQGFIDQIQELVEGLVEGMRAYLETQRSDLEGLAHRLRLLHPLHLLRDYSQRAIEWQERLIQSMRHGLDREDRNLQALTGRLNALSPLAVLGRGYSITFWLPSRAVVTDANALHVGDDIETFLAKGRLTSRVTDTALTTLDPDAADA